MPCTKPIEITEFSPFVGALFLTYIFFKANFMLACCVPWPFPFHYIENISAVLLIFGMGTSVLCKIYNDGVNITLYLS
jgi:hypothetical protein